MKKLLLYSAFGLGLSVHAQAPVTATLEANNVKALLNVSGALFNNGIKGQFIPIQPGLAEKSLLRGSGIWAVGIDPAGNLRGAVAVNDQTDFQPGALSEDGSTANSELNNIWEVTCTDVSQHLADYRDDGVVDNPNFNVYAFPAKGNVYFAANNNNIELPQTEQPLAPFHDRDEDGKYGPNRGDYPTIEVRGCPLNHYPKQQDWFVANDLGVHPSGLKPLQLEVQTQVLAFETATASPINNTVYVRYLMINRTSEQIDSCYVGLFADFEIGNGSDDFIGSIPDHYVMYGYNGDNNDNGNFGSNIPVMAVDMLRGPLDSTGYEMELGRIVPVDQVSGLQPVEYFNLLSGRQANGAPGPNAGFLFPDNPNIAGGNSEQALGHTPGQRAALASYGPFTLLPGAVNELIVAYYFVNTPGATPLQNVQQLYEDANVVQNLFDNCFDIQDTNCDGLVATHSPGDFTGWSFYPNPASSTFSIDSHSETFRHIAVTDLLGHVLWSVNLENPVQQYILQTENLPNGVYFLQIEGGSQKLLVQH